MNTNTNITTLGLSGITIAGSTTVTGFEDTKAVGTGLTLGTDILAGCTQEGLNILLPAITDVKVAATYKKTLSKPTYYEYNGTSDRLGNGLSPHSVPQPRNRLVRLPGVVGLLMGAHLNKSPSPNVDH